MAAFLPLLRRSLLAGVCVVLCLAWAPIARADEEGSPSPVVRAYAAWQEGDLGSALEWSAKAVESADATAYAWTLRGYLLSRAGLKVEAVTAYRRSAELDPGDARTQNNLGAVLLQMGRVEAAATPLARAVELDARYADAQNNLGAAYERAGRLDQARSAYRAATRADPQHVHAHNNLGALALRQGREAEARASLERARELAPTSSVPALNLLLLGGRDLAAGELFESLQAAARAPGASPRVRARALAALAGRAAGQRDFETARRLYLEALALRPDDAMLLNNVAVAEDQLGLEREAILHLQAALEIRPGMLVARNNIGIVHVHRGDLERAERVFRGVLADDRRFHRAHYNLGVVLAARGQLPDALASLEVAAALAPFDAEVRYNLGLIRRQLGGGADEERRNYERALELDPNFSEAHFALGCLLADPQTRADLRDEARAAVHLRRFLELSLPSDDEGRGEAQSWLEWLDQQQTAKPQ